MCSASACSLINQSTMSKPCRTRATEHKQATWGIIHVAQGLDRCVCPYSVGCCWANVHVLGQPDFALDSVWKFTTNAGKKRQLERPRSGAMSHSISLWARFNRLYLFRSRTVATQQLASRGRVKNRASGQQSALPTPLANAFHFLSSVRLGLHLRVDRRVEAVVRRNTIEIRRVLPQIPHLQAAGKQVRVCQAPATSSVLGELQVPRPEALARESNRPKASLSCVQVINNVDTATLGKRTPAQSSSASAKPK